MNVVFVHVRRTETYLLAARPSPAQATVSAAASRAPHRYDPSSEDGTAQHLHLQPQAGPRANAAAAAGRDGGAAGSAGTSLASPQLAPAWQSSLEALQAPVSWPDSDVSGSHPQPARHAATLQPPGGARSGTVSAGGHAPGGGRRAPAGLGSGTVGCSFSAMHSGSLLCPCNQLRSSHAGLLHACAWWRAASRSYAPSTHSAPPGRASGPAPPHADPQLVTKAKSFLKQQKRFLRERQVRARRAPAPAPAERCPLARCTCQTATRPH